MQICFFLLLKIQHKLMHNNDRSALFINITDLVKISQGIGGGLSREEEGVGEGWGLGD